ncbi:MAG: formylglycine-generating enzyme family protein [Deltaproteobacteria bacterium]|nr:formylglycine-generating enzyme family protein [Deltaproteobacteria bacterium]
MPTPPPAPWASSTGHDGFGPFSEIDVDGVIQRFRLCPPGHFLMGAPLGAPGAQEWEGPPRPVRLRHGLWMADCPVTQALWAAVTGQRPSGVDDPAAPDLPVEQVSWVEAEAFCLRLGALRGLPAAGALGPGWALRLPTEAEWEYACRAGGAVGPSGRVGDAPAGDQAGGSAGSVEAVALSGTQPVRRGRPNPWGLFDLGGNVWEWCADAVSLRAPLGGRWAGAPTVDPLARRGRRRALRGGAWHDRWARAPGGAWRPTARHSGEPWDRSDDQGLRLCVGPVLGPVRGGVGGDARGEDGLQRAGVGAADGLS